MYTIDLKEEQKQKEKERQKKIDKLIEQYDKAQESKSKSKNENKKDKSTEKKAEANFLTKDYSSNPHLNRLIKCMMPVALGVGVGLVFWGGGFLVNELSTMAPALSGLSLNTGITNIIATATFWKVIALIAAVCALAYLIWEATSTITKKISAKAENKGKNHFQEKEIVNSLSQSNNIYQNQQKTNKQQLSSSYYNYVNNEQNKAINYQENINKNSYNSPTQNNISFDSNKYQKNLNLIPNINKNNRNIYEMISQNKNNFSKENKEYNNSQQLNNKNMHIDNDIQADII